MKKQRILAVQLPAPCPLSCNFCRTPEHNIGDSKKVIESILQHLSSCDEVYLTSNGETGLFSGFNALLQKLFDAGKRVSVLCATKTSIKKGLTRVEISLNQFTNEIAKSAIYKAKKLNIPVVISMVDDGTTQFNLKQIAQHYGVDAVLVRALQREGRSSNNHGITQYYKANGINFGICPVPAYHEISSSNDSFDTVCINHFGKQVPYLGDIE